MINFLIHSDIPFFTVVFSSCYYNAKIVFFWKKGSLRYAIVASAWKCEYNSGYE